MSYSERLERLSAVSLESLRRRGDLIFAFKCINGPLSCSDMGLQLCESSTRGGGVRLIPPVARRNKVKHLFKYRVPAMWNRLPLTVLKCKSLCAFKSQLSKHENVL